MPAYKRTDPGKLAREREKIRKSQEEMQKPSEPNLIVKAYSWLKKANERKRTIQELKKNPLPREEGATFVGFKKKKDDSA